MENENQENFHSLFEEFDSGVDRVISSIDDLSRELDEFRDRLAEVSRPLSIYPARALNQVVLWGFVPGAKVRLAGLDEDLVFAGYTEGQKMRFVKPSGESTHASVEATALHLGDFTLLGQGAEIPFSSSNGEVSE